MARSFYSAEGGAESIRRWEEKEKCRRSMYTIVTTCPSCKTSQLADGRLIGKKVKCAKCDEEFKCTKKLGPVPWARQVNEGESSTSFRKVATKVLFTYGIAVPVSHQELFMEHLGEEMSFGSSRMAVVVLDGLRFKVKVSYFKNRRNEPSLHFLWKANEAIALKLQELLHRAYNHFMVEGNSDYIEGESVALAPAASSGVFELSIYTSGADVPVQGNLFAPTKRKKPMISLKDKGVKDLLADLAI